VLDLLLPQRCVVCAAPATQLCGRCVGLFQRLASPLCERCGAPTAWSVQRCRECFGRRLAFARARSAVAYDDAVRVVVGAWKERGLRRLVAIAAVVVAEVVPRPDGLVTYVPADPDRGLRRGHHPPHALAEVLAEKWELPCAATLGRRRGRRQRGLSRADRRRNVRSLFKAVDAPACAVLIDDVFTSGATVNAAAAALRKAGSRRVEVVTFARVVR
jgi:predicted amidophosphoribosyltransferase